MIALATLIQTLMGWAFVIRIGYLFLQELAMPNIETTPLIFETIAIFVVASFLLKHFIGEPEDINPKKN